jgi:alpha-L-fucosidase 2
VKKSLELRGDGESGWSSMWRTALWARLQNPERAYANLKILITTRTLPNMFDQGPPFQIDGNLGGTAAITEMLVQSTPNEIVVLPALPHQWSSGSLKGVRVPGGGKVDIVWNAGRLTELRECGPIVPQSTASGMSTTQLTWRLGVTSQSRWQSSRSRTLSAVQ